MSSTAVVILNWNGENQLRSFLPSVVEHTPDAEIIIADNASTDASVKWIQTAYPQIRIIRLNKNHGYAGGYNEALKEVESDYLLLLNSDVEVTANWLSPLSTLLDANQTIAACQPKILSQREKKFFEYAGAAGGFMDSYGIPFCRGRIFTTIEKDVHQYDDPVPIFWASGACLMVRNEVFKRAHGFDASFFAHMEEIDLCWTIHRMGYQIAFQPKSLVYHVGAATLKKENPKKTYLNFRNSLWMLHKHLPKDMLLKVLFIRLCMDGLAGLHYLVRGQWPQTVAVFNAHMSFYFSKNKSEKRKALSRYPFFYKDQPIILGSSIIGEYYLKGKKTYQALDIKKAASL